MTNKSRSSKNTTFIDPPWKTDVERRVAPRAPTETLIKSNVFHDGRWLEGRIKNLSVGGVLIETVDTVPAKVKIRVCCYVPPSENRIDCQAQITHVTPGVSMGLEFLSLSDVQRATIAAYVQRHFFGVETPEEH